MSILLPITLPPELRAQLAAALARLNPEIHAVLALSLSRVYAPACTLNAWQWSQQNIELRPEESRARAGAWDSADTIYVRRVMEFITAPNEREFIIRKSSQLGFTLAYLLIVCYLAATAPTHVLYGMDSKDQAKKISARLERLLTTNSALAGTLTGKPDDTLQTYLFKLRGMDVVLAGSGSEGQYANMPAGLVILDELDLHIPGVNQRANTIDTARERIKQASLGGKLIAGGKPQEFSGETNQNYLTGTREQIHVPCLRCGWEQPLVFDKKWFRFEQCKDVAGHWDMSRVLADTHFICQNELCGAQIREEDKPSMLRRYKCIATNHGQDDWKPFPGRVSMWVNDLVSLTPTSSWGNIAMQFIGANSPSKLRVFFNGVLAMPQQEAKTEVTKSDLAKLNGGYAHGCIPKKPAINPGTGAAAIVLCSDVQGSGEKKWVKVGFCPDGEAFVIDYGIALHLDELKAEANEPVWLGFEPPPEKEIEEIKALCIAEGRDYHASLREKYPARDFFIVPVGGIDEGHDTFVVRDFCHSTKPAPDQPPLFFPFKGIAKVHAVEIVHEIPDKFRTAKTDDAPFITVYHFSDDDLKQDLYVGRIAGFDAIKSGKSTIPRLWFPAHAEDDFLSELTQEKRAQIKWKGRLTWMWVPPKAPNDWGDALKICLALWHVIKGQFPAPAVPVTPQAAAA